MKTINEVKKLIDGFITDQKAKEKANPKKKMKPKEKQHLAMLKECLLYLEFNPKKEIVEIDLKKQNNLLKSLTSQYDQ